MAVINFSGPKKVDYHWNFPLTQLEFKVKGIYATSNSWLPERMCLLHPEVVRSFAELQSDSKCELVYSDMYRTFAESLNARRKKGAGLVAFPGNSGHNWGISFDLAVEQSIKVLQSQHKISVTGTRNKKMIELYDYFAQFGWQPMNSVRQKFENGTGFCSEEWHFNSMIIDSKSVIDWTNETFAEELSLTIPEIKSCLNELGYKVWPINDVIDKATQDAILKFQKDYDLQVDGIPGKMTQRTLACFCSEIEYFEESDLSDLELGYL